MQAPRPFYLYLVGWRAKRLRDPIEKLRFLRQSVPVTQGRPAFPRWGRVMVGLACCCAILTAVAIHFRPVQALPLAIHSAAAAHKVIDVWMVERKGGVEMYSNGLRVDNQYATSNERRSYRVFDGSPGDTRPAEWRSKPAGIVFHTTESLLAPFAPNYNETLQRLGQELLAHIRLKRSYHFLIDRFGRVFRIVHESDSANHAGHSVWADEQWKYINLNHSFLGVSFETQTRPGSDAPTISPAQIHAGRILIEMLRSKYSIPAHNCVTHAQVSVNAGKMLVGYHTDWAANFPFAQFGLPDNYVEPLPSLYAFGFGYDSGYVTATGAKVWQSLLLAEERLRLDALSSGLTVEAYRSFLRRSYRQMIAASKETAAHKESD